ncbi:MAG: hypothetical protein HUJ78_05945 [Mogibacterium sp.]|nr:hypothetical protein [Mogibacterium sp.]
MKPKGGFLFRFGDVLIVLAIIVIAAIVIVWRTAVMIDYTQQMTSPQTQVVETEANE